VALVFVGADDQSRRKGATRKTLGLTGNQEELVEAVFTANPRTIVVQMSAGPLTVPWLAKISPRCCRHGGRAKRAGTRLRLLFLARQPGRAFAAHGLRFRGASAVCE